MVCGRVVMVCGCQGSSACSPQYESEQVCVLTTHHSTPAACVACVLCCLTGGISVDQRALMYRHTSAVIKLHAHKRRYKTARVSARQVSVLVVCDWLLRC